MEKLRHRLKFYLIGFGIGIIITFMIFGNRGCSWLPGNRVKNMIAEKEIFIGDSLFEVMQCAGVTNVDIYALLNEDGDVNFSESSTQSYPKKYLLEGEKEDQPIGITYALYDSTAEVIAFNFAASKNCSSSKTNFSKRIVPLPDEDVRHILESHEMRILNHAECQMKCLQLSEDQVKNFHTSATFVAEKSKPKKFPNPEFVMRGQLNGQTLEIYYIISDSRTRIVDISPNTCNCME